MNTITKNSSPTNNKNITKWRHNNSSFSSKSSSSSLSSSSFTSSSLEELEFSMPNDHSPSTSPSGIPFSWETIPGIPKTSQILKKVDNSSCCSSSRRLKNTILPLPPPAGSNAVNKKGHVSRSDPFYAALVECSKRSDVDNQEVVFGGGGGFAKSLSTRFGNVSMSCKNSSSVANSVIFVPRGGQRRIKAYDHRCS
ncbi:hypothetical protein vseg_019131 [Gypsophila vaccaria]